MLALGAFLVSMGLGGSLYQPPRPLSQTDLIADYVLTHLQVNYSPSERSDFRAFVSSMASNTPH